MLPSPDLLSCGEDFCCDFCYFLGSARVEDTNRERHLAPERCPCIMLCDWQCVLHFPYLQVLLGTFFLSLDVLNTNLLDLHQPPLNVARKRNTEKLGWATGTQVCTHDFSSLREGWQANVLGGFRADFGEDFGEDFLGRIFLSLSLRSPCQKNPQKQIRVKICTEIRTQKIQNPHENPHAKIAPKIRTNRTQKSAHKNPHAKIRTASGCSEKLSSRPPPTQDLTITLGEGMRWAQEQIETLLSWTTNTCVWCLLVHYSLTRKKSPHGTKKTFFSRPWRENPLSRNRFPTLCICNRLRYTN